MRNQLATAMALALVVGVVGLGAVPYAVAVDPDCQKEFDIEDSEVLGLRLLPASGEETGREDVTAAGGNEEVTVRLESNSDKLEFGVFFRDGSNCLVAADQDPALSTCGAAEVLDTTPANLDEDEKICQIDAPASGSRDYFVHVKNLQGDALSYRIWMSA